MAVLELRRLHAFIAIAEEGHITRAAERLGMQQPPLTRLLQSLVAAGLGVSIVPASMQRLRGDGIAYRSLSDCPGLTAPLHLATRIGDQSSVLRRFRERVLLAAQAENSPVVTTH